MQSIISRIVIVMGYWFIDKNKNYFKGKANMWASKFLVPVKSKSYDLRFNFLALTFTIFPFSEKTK
jgi:hypothetical protein